jgi:Zn-dependent protease
MPRSPGAELLIALAGPAVNVAIAGGLIGLAALGVFGSPWVESDLGYFAFNLVAANAVLAGFNLIPAFPMDGGRVLRALLTGPLGRARATGIAAGLGRGLAVLFGLYSFLNGMWFQVFLAAFIYMAAGSELSQVLADERRRRYGDGSGIWTAPPGYHWVRRGNGVWQLAPVTVNITQGFERPWN